MDYLKRQIIESDRSPDTIFNAVAKTFRIPTKSLKDEAGKVVGTIEGGLLKKGQTIQDIVDLKNYKAVTDGFLETSTDYRAAVTDTFMQTAKQVYQKQFFDRLSDTGLESGLFFRSANEAVAKGVNPNNLQQVKPLIKYGEEFQSKCFLRGLMV